MRKTWQPQNEDARKTSSLSLAPLIDVTFILLIFFMLVTQFSRFSPVDLKIGAMQQVFEKKKSEGTKAQKLLEKLVLHNDGHYVFSGKTINSLSNLEITLSSYALTVRQAISTQSSQISPLLLVEPQDTVALQQLVDVLSIVKKIKGLEMKLVVKKDKAAQP